MMDYVRRGSSDGRVRMPPMTGLANVRAHTVRPAGEPTRLSLCSHFAPLAPEKPCNENRPRRRWTNNESVNTPRT